MTCRMRTCVSTHLNSEDPIRAKIEKREELPDYLVISFGSRGTDIYIDATHPQFLALTGGLLLEPLEAEK